MKSELGSGSVHCPVLELAGAAELTYAGVIYDCQAQASIMMPKLCKYLHATPI